MLSLRKWWNCVTINLKGVEFMQFRIKAKAGTHRENGRTYKAGDVVESNSDLINLFPEKFELLGGPEGRRTVLTDGSNRTAQPGSKLAEEHGAPPAEAASDWDSLGTKATRSAPAAHVATKKKK